MGNLSDTWQFYFWLFFNLQWINDKKIKIFKKCIEFQSREKEKRRECKIISKRSFKGARAEVLPLWLRDAIDLNGCEWWEWWESWESSVASGGCLLPFYFPKLVPFSPRSPVCDPWHRLTMQYIFHLENSPFSLENSLYTAKEKHAERKICMSSAKQEIAFLWLLIWKCGYCNHEFN